jgi:hypothetical protein
MTKLKITKIGAGLKVLKDNLFFTPPISNMPALAAKWYDGILGTADTPLLKPENFTRITQNQMNLSRIINPGFTKLTQKKQDQVMEFLASDAYLNAIRLEAAKTRKPTARIVTGSLAVAHFNNNYANGTAEIEGPATILDVVLPRPSTGVQYQGVALRSPGKYPLQATQLEHAPICLVGGDTSVDFGYPDTNVHEQVVINKLTSKKEGYDTYTLQKVIVPTQNATDDRAWKGNAGNETLAQLVTTAFSIQGLHCDDDEEPGVESD